MGSENEMTIAQSRLQFATFRVASEWFAVPVEAVQEVLKPVKLTSVPSAHPVVCGLLNLRGEIIPAIDLGFRFQSDPAHKEDSMMVALSVDSEVVALFVEEVGDVISSSVDDIRDIPAGLSGTVKDNVKRIIRGEKHTFLELDPLKILSFDGAINEF
ncbi:MAG: chemotaxis protein CheW [Bdellovibrionales bacterium]|nr:chemotaxis protein CheW [Bdellovibrionales bacterium]